MLAVLLILAVFNGQQMTDQERQRNFEHWERCVNVKEGDNFDAAMIACDQLLQPQVPMSMENRS